jgi:NAD(P)-dependent dehydrogenase (short-subunit alcohol dehydrogenase family)
VVIAGAGSGQGREGAILFAREGANLALTDINEDGLNETVKLVYEERDTTDVFARPTDLTDRCDMSAFVDEVTARFE